MGRRKKSIIQIGYSSPRWSQEITDCSMPMILDTYSLCGYRCFYCFSFFRKAIGPAKKKYFGNMIQSVNVEEVKKIFTGTTESKALQQFVPFTRKKFAIQWGGLADQFDEYEREHGVSLELLRFFRKIKYPVSMSTKGTWWVDDERYAEQFRGAKHFNLKISIIIMDWDKGRKVEVLCPSSKERLKAMEKVAGWGIGGVTLRLRPFIVGISSSSYIELIRRAKDAGAEAVSTEFLCVEERAKLARQRFKEIGRVAGYDLMKMYKQHSPGQSGYLRLSRNVKRPYMEKMKEECDKLDLRFYVSDVHFKELCHNSSCCGLRSDWNYTRGHFTKALLLAKKNGRVTWSEIEGDLDYADKFLFRRAQGFNTTSSEVRAQFYTHSMKDWLRYQWNNVNGGKSPYKYFGGILFPVGTDSEGNVVYEYKKQS